MSATVTYENALDAAKSGVRVVNDHLPLDRLSGVDWPDVSVPDVDFDDVFDEVNDAVRRYPAATIAIVAVSVIATCGMVWFVLRKRRSQNDQTELSLAGAA